MAATTSTKIEAATRIDRARILAMQITFLGATRTVTGSKYLVERDGARVLVDCGLFQGEKALRLRNWAPLPVPPSSIRAVVLTHAHLDHSGYLPLFVENGFTGRIFCSEATYELCRILLLDSGRLQEEEAAFANRHGYSKHAPALPLYTAEQAERCLRQFVPVAFGQPVPRSRAWRRRWCRPGTSSVRRSSRSTPAARGSCSRATWVAHAIRSCSRRP